MMKRTRRWFIRAGVRGGCCGCGDRVFSGEKLAFVIFLSTINRHAVYAGYIIFVFSGWMILIR